MQFWDHREYDIEDAKSTSSDGTDYVQERIELYEQLREMKRERADPKNYCGDTDIEDLFEGGSNGDDVTMHDELNRKSIWKGLARTKSSRKMVAKKKRDPAKGSTSEPYLEDPPNEDGGISSLDDETDEENKPPPGKKRRSRRAKVTRAYFDEKNIMDQSQLCIGLCFSDAHQFKKALKTYHIVQGRNYSYLKNNPNRVIVKCKQTDVRCDFYTRASQIGMEKTLQLREMVGPHTCPESMHTSRDNSTWLSHMYEENFRSDPDWKVEAFMDQCMRDLGTDIMKTMAYSAKRKAGENVLGNHKKQYKRIRDYLQRLINKNPGSIAVVTTENRIDQGLNPRFNGLFICLNGQKKGFLEGCRPFIGIDGYFVKLTNGAQVLADSGRAGNNNMFFVAFGVVGKDDTNNWTWFREMLHVAIGGGEQHEGWTIMSDRQKGLMNAMHTVFLSCEHIYCKRHLLQNMAFKGWRGQKYKEWVDVVVYATTKWDYE